MNAFRRGVAAVDSRPWLALLLLLATLGLGVEIHLNLPLDLPMPRQMNRLNPDAKLYYGLAENLRSGAGYVDTTRNRNVVPTIGHPALLAVASGTFGWTPARQAWLALWASVLLLVAAVRVQTGSNSYALVAAGLYAAYLQGTSWLAGNVESSIVLSNSALLLLLACFDRSGYRPWVGALAGGVLALALWIRPIFLYALHLATAAALLYAAVTWWRAGRAALPRVVVGWLALVGTAQALMLGMNAYSHARYGDPRLVTGTYGAWSLYGGNSPYVPPDEVFRTRVRHPPGFRRLLAYFQQTEDWQERQAFFMDRVLAYWREQPVRALHGWTWRLQRFFGLHADALARDLNRSLWGPRVHPFAGAALLSLLAVRLARGRRPPGDRLEAALSPGLVAAGLFVVYAAVHALFAYAGFRYVSGGIPLLVAALVLLAADVWPAPARAGVAAQEGPPAGVRP